MMDALRFAEPQHIELINVPEPADPGPGEALVRTHRVGICGTDLGGYLGRHPFFTYPRIPGHELGVEVLAVGPGVESDGLGAVRVGDRCAVEPYLNNPQSFASRRGLMNCCQDVQVIGVHIDGGMRQRFIIRADKLHPSSELSYEQLALVETLAIGCHACNRADPSPDDHVLVIGVGPIGCAVIEFFRLRKCKIAVMDLNADRLEVVQRLYGTKDVLTPSTDQADLAQMREITEGELFSYVVDATGSAKSMGQAPHYVRHGGTLVFVGNTTQEIVFHPMSIQKPELTIKTSRNALPHEFPFIIEAIEQGRIDTEPWITHRTDLAKLPDVFESYTRPETGVLKAIVAV